MLTGTAIDLPSVLSMSSESERVFSGAKHITSDKTASLKPDMIKALECCKSVLRVGALRTQRCNGQGAEGDTGVRNRDKLVQWYGILHA